MSVQYSTIHTNEQILIKFGISVHFGHISGQKQNKTIKT